MPAAIHSRFSTANRHSRCVVVKRHDYRAALLSAPIAWSVPSRSAPAGCGARRAAAQGAAFAGFAISAGEKRDGGIALPAAVFSDLIGAHRRVSEWLAA